MRARDLGEAGIPRAYLQRLCDRGLLEQVDRGLYRIADAPVTELSTVAEVSKRVPHAVICLLSALQIHGMTTEAPHAVWVLIARPARMPKVTRPTLEVVRASGGPSYERLLFRLASSQHASRFVQKGAALFTLWTGKPHRATRDLDFLGFGDGGVDSVRQVFLEVLALEVPDDGVRFDLGSFTAGLIREEQEYGGVRIELVARITNAQVRLQIDVGFGDAITPEPSVVEFPPLLDFPAPRLRAYPKESVLAEKLEAIVQLGMANTRMKDFYDLAQLARDFDFDGELLRRAIRATFDRRKTVLPATTPVALTPAFWGDPTKQTQWSGFRRKADVRDAGTLAETIQAVRAFVELPLAAAAGDLPAPGTWRAGDSQWQ